EIARAQKVSPGSGVGAKALAVDLDGARQRVAGVDADQRVRGARVAESAAQARDLGVQAAARTRRWLLAPQVLDQLLRPHGGAARERERSDEPALLGSVESDRLAGVDDHRPEEPDAEHHR